MKTKENLLTGYVFTVVTAILALIVTACIFFGSALTAHAEENMTYTYNYSYHATKYNQYEDYYTESYQCQISSPYSLAGYLTNERSVRVFQYNGSSLAVASAMSTVLSYDLVENTGVSGVVEKQVGDVYSFSSFSISSTYNAWGSHDSPNVIIASCNIPYFSTYAEMENYLLTGDTSGQLNAPTYDADFTDSNSYDASYSLQGFKCDNSITASWTGATMPTLVPWENEEVEVNEYVKIYVNYGSGSKEHKVVPLSALSYSVQFDNVSSSEEPLVAMEFVPIYSHGVGIFGKYFYGNTVVVNFDAKGNIISIDELATNTATGADNAINDFLQGMGNKGTLGYLQNVVYKEENHVLSSRTATISWSTAKDIPNARIQIVSENMYGTWTEQFTGMHVYKDYSDDVMYSHGSVTFVSQEPVRTWCEEKGYNITNPLKYRTYLTNYYYVRLVVYDESADTYDYGGWVRIDINQGNSTQLPWTNTGTGDWNQITGEWEQDNTSDDSYNYETGSDGTVTDPIHVENLDSINLNAFTWMWNNIKAMIATMGDFPLLVTTVFGFLPQQFIVALGALLVAVVLMRFLGR